MAALHNFAELSAALPARVADQAAEHLLRFFKAGEHQEELCLALWRPSVGTDRFTAMIVELILPAENERVLQGNVSLEADFLARGAQLAASRGLGLAAMHSHPVPGWQGMSRDDVETEQSRAPFVLASTGKPLLGMTIGTDGAWSARFWEKVAPKQYERRWCRSVRVVGTRLSVTFHPEYTPRDRFKDELRRSIAVWGEDAQAVLQHLHVGVIGLGSVGRMVSEGLARMGVGRVTLLDFDTVQPHNLDRLIGATRADAASGRSKVELARDGYLQASTLSRPDVRAVTASVVEPKGYRAALDCDVLFSCVDRHWPRRVLNHLAYAHLIPVVDGGIRARFAAGKFRGVEWSLRTAGPDRCCLKCAGAYEPSFIEVERTGLADDPKYIAGLPKDHELRSAENVFSFSMCLAGHELLQFVALITALKNKPDLGEQRFYYNLAELHTEQKACDPGCTFPSLIASGEGEYDESMLTGNDPSFKKQ